VAAGLSAPLILTASSGAGFVNVHQVLMPNEFGLYVVRVYAEFDNPGGDQVHHVAGTPGAPMNINVIGGEFYNHPFGSDLAPSTAFVNAFPSLAYDSFYTIGIKALATGEINALNLVNLPHLTGTSVHTTNGSWGLVPPTAAQGNPFDPVHCYPGDGRVLIGQFSMDIPDEGPYGVTGEFLISFVSDGTVVLQSYVNFSAIVPAPGLPALFGLGGLLLTRRRRRQTR
jgi:hypothetical protein